MLDSDAAVTRLLRWWRLRRSGPPSSKTRKDVGRLQAEFQTMFENVALGIVITDENGRFVRTNAAYERFLGYEKGELIGRSARRVTHPDHYPLDLRMFGEMTRGERDSYQTDKRYIRKDGSEIWGRLTASIVTPPDSTARYFMGMVENIHEHRRISAQLDESRQHLELLNRRLQLYIDRAPLACVVWGADQLVRVWNPSAERMFGYSQAEAIGRNVYELTSTPEGLQVIEKVRKAVHSGEPHPDNLIVENRRKDGSRLHCHWHFTILRRPSGEVDAAISFAIDISARLQADQERRLLESQLRQAQKMQSLGTLAGGIAHDFNNILLAISGNTRLATEDLAPDHPAQISLAEISKASARASSIVNQILEFSRREESPQAPFDLRAIIEESASFLRAALGTRTVLRLTISPERPVILGDPAQIHQILVNLATNAAHAMGQQGGELGIELSQIEVKSSITLHFSQLEPGRYYRLSIRDRGVGMPPQLLERIFEPFFTTKPRGEGTGLGLAVVHGIVKSHRGAIDVETIVGDGSTFHVYFPAYEGAMPDTEREATIERGRGQCILYVDDEEPLVYLISRVLTRLGYEVVGFTDAQTALGVFRSDPKRFDAVITDLSMPGMSGSELAAQIKKLSPATPVVMTSGYVRNEDRETALEAGIRELVLKPNTVEELGGLLHRLLAQRGSASEIAGRMEERMPERAAGQEDSATPYTATSS
jgi:PAS domain S-box-containing protein